MTFCHTVILQIQKNACKPVCLVSLNLTPIGIGQDCRNWNYQTCAIFNLLYSKHKFRQMRNY